MLRTTAPLIRNGLLTMSAKLLLSIVILGTSLSELTPSPVCHQESGQTRNQLVKVIVAAYAVCSL